MKALDRMGIYIGDIRSENEIPLYRLAEGLCSVGYLNRVESGQREADKLLTDTLLQRLGKSTENFYAILNQEEITAQMQRQNILVKIRRNSKIMDEAAWYEIKSDLSDYSKQHLNEVLHQQLVKIAELNIHYYQDTSIKELQSYTLDALHLTQPRYGTVMLKDLCLGRNECFLLLKYLELLALSDSEEAIRGYRELQQYLEQPRYSEQERLPILIPTIRKLAENAYHKNSFTETLSYCQEARKLLQAEHMTYDYTHFLELEINTSQTLGLDTRELLVWLNDWKEIKEQYGTNDELWLPYVENCNVYSVNQVIQERREMLGKSRNELAENICDLTTLYRIEAKGSTPQRAMRRKLLEAVGLSGERYDYELITTHYEDYNLRIQLNRLIAAKKYKEAEKLLQRIKESVPTNTVNLQYLKKLETKLLLKQSSISEHERKVRLEELLYYTLPKNYEDILPVSMLSINEMLLLLGIAISYKTQGKQKESIRLLLHLKTCLEKNIFSLEQSDVYALCIAELETQTGNTGQYEEADKLAKSCLKSEFKRHSGYLIPDMLYDQAWNLEQYLKNTSEEKKHQKHRNASSYFAKRTPLLISWAMSLCGGTQRNMQKKSTKKTFFTNYDHPSPLYQKEVISYFQ